MTRATTFRATAVIGGVLLAMLMIMTVSRAAFSDPTSNAGNEAQAGTVYLTNDAPGNTDPGPGDGSGDPMFIVSVDGPFAPGESVSHCINIQYVGTLDAIVRLSDLALTDADGLAQYMQLAVYTDDFSGGCSGGTLVGTIDPLADGDPALGEDWAGVPGGSSELGYRFELAFDDTDDNSVQGAGVQFNLQWTATS